MSRVRRLVVLAAIGALGNPTTGACLAGLLALEVPNEIQVEGTLLPVAAGVLPVVAMLVFFAAIIAELLGALRGRIDDASSRSVIVGIMVLALSWGSTWYLSKPMWELRIRQARRCTVHSAGVVAALEEFKEEEGEYPDNLAELVPTYVPSLPRTRMFAYPAFRYSRSVRMANGAIVPYALSVDMPFGLDCDRLVYWPTEAYPAGSLTGRIILVGKWAYVAD